MTLNQALGAIRANRAAGPKRSVFLAAGFQPLHTATFLHAFAAQRQPKNEASIISGLYGDLAGNLSRAAASDALAAVVIVEWADLDPRLGLRATGGWGAASKQDILASVRPKLAQLTDGIRQTGARMPVAVAGPTLPLPPVGSTIRAQAAGIELELRCLADSFLLGLAELPGVRIVHPSRIDELSPHAPGRMDPKMELLAGFPYTVAHACAVAQSVAEVLWPPAPKKGLITDLDDTLWAGLVGEVGCHGVTWSQEHHTQSHGLYQQMLGHLADCGVLLAVSSKNELQVVQEALGRQDLLVNSQVLFPVLAGWGKKSANVAEVLRVWNIGPGDVVFVDDNPMELSEVEQAFPGITCLRFPAGDASAVWELLGQLRDLFGKPVLVEEDRIRRESIRASAALRDSGPEASSPEFLRSLQGTVTIDYSVKPSDSRALELLNKTNQFNLNGIRMDEGEWQKCLSTPGTMAATVSYQDKFGPLGKIAVMVARREEGSQRLQILHWVMSCRAFSRRIEHHALESLFRHSGAVEAEFNYRVTERNQPLQEFLAAIGGTGGEGRLTADSFAAVCGELPHQTNEITAS